MAPGTSFGDMMQQAVKIKGAQMSTLRPQFDSWPTFFQNTLFLREDVTKLRSLPFAERLAAAADLKGKGNARYQAGDFVGAQNHYEEAVGVFRFVRNTHADWKTRGIRDEDLKVEDALGETAGERAEVEAFKVSCFLNMAQAQFQQKKNDLCVRACDFALEINAGANVKVEAKGLYRRAMARVTSLSSGSTDQDMAMADLAKAAKLDPTNKLIVSEARKLKARRAEQQATDKRHFSGMFERGDVVAEKEETKLRGSKGTKGGRGSGGGGGSGDGGGGGGGGGGDGGAPEGKVSSVVGGRTLEEQLKDMKSRIGQLHDEGAHDAAEQLQTKLDGINVKIEKEMVKHRQQRKEEEMNFDNPTAEMIADAKKKGIDLTDPAIVG